MAYYWRNLCILSVTVFLASLSWNQIIPYLPLYLKQIGAGDHINFWIAAAASAQAMASILAQPLWGKLADTVGRKPMIIRAGLCLTVIYYTLSLCHSPWQIVINRFCNGAFTGFIPGSMALIGTNTPREYAPRSVATAQTASYAGLIIGPGIGFWMAGRIGFRGSMIVSGTACLISTILVWLLVQEPNKGIASEKTSLAQDFAISIRNPVQSSIMLVQMLAWAWGAAISPYLILHLTGLNHGHALSKSAGMIISLPAVAFLLTAHFWSWLGERIRYERTIFAGLVCGGICGIVLAMMPTLLGFAAVFFSTGLLLAAIEPSTAAVTCTRIRADFRGRAYAIQQAAGTLGALLAPWGSGMVAEHTGYRGIFVFVGVIFMVGAVIFRKMSARWQDEEPEGAFSIQIPATSSVPAEADAERVPE